MAVSSGSGSHLSYIHRALREAIDDHLNRRREEVEEMTDTQGTLGELRRRTFQNMDDVVSSLRDVLNLHITQQETNMNPEGVIVYHIEARGDGGEFEITLLGSPDAGYRITEFTQRERPSDVIRTMSGEIAYTYSAFTADTGRYVGARATPGGDPRFTGTFELPNDKEVREFVEGPGLFKKGVKKFKALPFEEQSKLIRKDKRVKGFNPVTKTVLLDLGWAGHYRVEIKSNPQGHRLEGKMRNKTSDRNPFLSHGDFCLGNMKETYNHCLRNENYLECMKIMAAILVCKEDSHGYKRWEDCKSKRK
jgi:hypothetical protein